MKKSRYRNTNRQHAHCDNGLCAMDKKQVGEINVYRFRKKTL